MPKKTELTLRDERKAPTFTRVGPGFEDAGVMGVTDG